jgi:uncharacterized membrane protein YfcA
MDPGHILLLLAAGLTAGTVNAIAGGGSLVTFPALLATGLPAVPANVTNSVAVFPGYVGSVVGSRRDLRDLAVEHGHGRLLGLVPTTVVGTGVGCVLLLRTPGRAFDVVVPFLVLFAGAVLMFQDRLRSVVGRRHKERSMLPLHAMVGIGSVYGGYFGAALGVMLVAALGLVLDASMAKVSALKNAISALVGFITLLVFAVFGPVNWADVAVLAPATVTGGYVGARVARRLPASVLKGLIVSFAGVVGVVLLVRAFDGR